MPTGNIPAPISSTRGRRSRRRSSPRSAIIAAKLLVDERHRVLDIGCGFGGMGLYLAQHRRRARRPASRCRASKRARVAQQRAPRPGSPTASTSGCRTIATSRSRSTASSRSACSSMSASAQLRRIFQPRSARSAEGRRRDGAARDRPQRAALATPIRGSRNTSSPAAIFPPLSEVLAVDRTQSACSSPTSKSCACITPTR